MALRLAIAAAVLPVAQSIGSFLGSGTGLEGLEAAANKAMVATVFEHTRSAPVDLMLSHQLRMLSSSRKNVDQVAVINAKVKGVDNALGTAQDPVLAQMSRSYGTTGSVQVLELEDDEEKQVELFKKVFSLRQGSTTSFAKKFFNQNLSTPELKRKMAYFTAMAQFVDLCSKANFGVDLCINMEAESFLFRKDKQGLVELASKLYENDEDVVALQPPTYCEYTQARHKPSWAKASSWTNSSFTKCVANATKATPGNLANMVFHRERLMNKLPFSVDKDDLDLEKGFDHAFWAGLSPQGVVKGMQCGHSFVIRAATATSGCKGKPVQMKAQALFNGKSKADPKANERTQLDTLSGEYSIFNQRLVSGIEVMVDRLENGDFPPVMHNVANKCQDMCPSADRIMKEGMAW